MRGTPDQVGLAEWLANQQDGPAGDPASSEYQVPGGKKVALQKWIQGRADGCHFSGNATSFPIPVNARVRHFTDGSSA